MKYDFVEVGSCDFNTLHQTCYDWQNGITIDVVQGYLDNLPDKSNVKKICAAVSDSAGDSFLFTVSEETIERYELPSWARGCSSIDIPNPPLLEELRKRNIEHLYEKLPIQKVPISEILETNQVTQIGIFKTDLEGHDLDVVEALIDYGKVFPEVIIFEYRADFNDDRRDQLNSITRKLESNGYILDEYRGQDFKFVKKRSISVICFYDNSEWDIMKDGKSLENFKYYCSVHNYELKTVRNTGGGKFRSILDQLKYCEEGDWILCVDPDSIFMNTTRKIEDYIDDDYFMILPGDNTSFPLLIRKCQESILLLERICFDRMYGNLSYPGKGIELPDYEYNFIENFSTDNNLKHGIKYLKQRLLVSYWPNPHIAKVLLAKHINKNSWNPGDFIVKFSGYSKSEKILFMERAGNYRGGIIGSWSYDPAEGKIFMHPLEPMENVRVVLFDNGGNHFIYWDFPLIPPDDVCDMHFLDLGSAKDKIDVNTYHIRVYENFGQGREVANYYFDRGTS
jgi:hypothetical protein